MVSLKEEKKPVSFHQQTMKLKHKDSLHAHQHTISWVLNVKSNFNDYLQTIQEGSTKYEGEKWLCFQAFLRPQQQSPNPVPQESKGGARSTELLGGRVMR